MNEPAALLNSFPGLARIDGDQCEKKTPPTLVACGPGVFDCIREPGVDWFK
jgi:hypothetical protein